MDSEYWWSLAQVSLYRLLLYYLLQDPNSAGGKQAGLAHAEVIIYNNLFMITTVATVCLYDYTPPHLVLMSSCCVVCLSVMFVCLFPT